MQKVNDEKIEKSLNKNKYIKSKTYADKVSYTDPKEFSNEEELYIIKLKEDYQDAEHSLNNAKKLNKIYSQLMHIFFGGWWFYFWLLFLFVLFVISDNNFMQFEFFSNFFNETIIFILKKFFYALGGIFVILLTFPTAKGIRKLFRSVVDILKHKVKNI